MTHVVLVLAQLFFASLSVAGKFAFKTIPPNAVVLTRVFGGLVVFTLVARRQGWKRLDRADRALLVACGLFGVVLNQVLFINGLRRTTATSASLISSTIPVFAALFAVLLGRERFRWQRALGIAVAMSGVLVLFDVRNLSTSGEHVLGNLMCLLNCASYAMYLVLVRPLSNKYAPMHLTAMLFLVGLVFVTPLGLPAWVELAPRLGWHEVGLLAFIVAFPTVGAYSLTQVGLRRAESSLVATYIYLQPVFATIGAVLILHERPGASVGIAAALVFTGVFLSTRVGQDGSSQLPRAPESLSNSR